MKAYKGFDENLKCRDFQYEIGEEYEEDVAELCKTGFHACEAPLDVFCYYSPNKSRYCKVELDDVSSKTSDDSKRCGKKIKIGAEIGIHGLIKAHFDYVKEHTTHEVKNYGAATAGNSGAATAGDYGAATAGDSGAATAGYRGAATAGYSGAATAGDSGAATAGDYGAATSRGKSASGKEGLSVARGNEVTVKGGLGAILVIAEENEDNFKIKDWKAAVVDGENIKADTWYKLVDGEFEEVE